MKNTKIGQILNRLLKEKKIRVAELARRVNLPQPTIHRIATGACEHPHLSSLAPIADFFSITVDQLKGHELIPWLDRAFKVPLLTWEEVVNWSLKKVATQNRDFILTDAVVGKNGVALKIKDSSMEPVFPKNTILIVYPDKKFKDRSYVIAKLAHFSEGVFRQLLIDADNWYLKPLSPDFEKYKMSNFKNGDKILSVMVQAKRDFTD